MIEETVYEYIIIEFDSPFMQNDRLTYTDVTASEVREQFTEWCEGYDLDIESTNPRTFNCKEKK